jgi:hypothetical protein
MAPTRQPLARFCEQDLYSSKSEAVQVRTESPSTEQQGLQCRWRHGLAHATAAAVRLPGCICKGCASRAG